MVRAWFGDEEAERRRLADEQRYREEERYRDRFQDRDRGGFYSPRASSTRGSMYGAPGYGGAAFGAYGPMDSFNPYTPYGSPRGDLGTFGQPVHYRDIRDDGRRWRAGDPEESTHDYHSWRDRQMETRDRDYHDYRKERQSAFEKDFGTWRENRQSQRNSLQQVREHMDVVGSDGEHVGTVDHVRGDHIKLTRGDSAAGGHHHSIPCAWINSVDTKVTLNRTAADTKKGWQESAEDRDEGAHILNRSFSGTY